jgi:hypothetical protein
MYVALMFAQIRLHFSSYTLDLAWELCNEQADTFGMFRHLLTTTILSLHNT